MFEFLGIGGIVVLILLLGFYARLFHQAYQETARQKALFEAELKRFYSLPGVAEAITMHTQRIDEFADKFFPLNHKD